jgi:hypothetical protein
MVDFFYHLDYLPLPEVEAITSPSDSETEIEFVHSGPSERMRRVPKKKVQVGVLDGESLATIAPEVPAPEPVPDSVAAPQPVYIIEHAKVFAIAVKYQVDGLRNLAAMKFKQSVRASWDHDDFAHAISIVYNSTADNVSQLRDITIDIIHDHFDALKHKAEFESAVSSIPALAYALLKRVGTISGCTNGHKGERATKFCMGCYTTFDICAACKKWKWCPLCKKILDGLGSGA